VALLSTMSALGFILSDAFFAYLTKKLIIAKFEIIL